MIQKRKTKSTQLKPNPKPKNSLASNPTKQHKQPPKKPKKEHSEQPHRLQPTKSSIFKLHREHDHHDRKPYLEDDIYPQDENYNRMNLPGGFTQIVGKGHGHGRRETHDEETRAQEYVHLRRSASAGGLKAVRQVRKSLSPGLSKECREKSSDIKHKYSSKPSSRSEREKEREKLGVLLEKVRHIPIPMPTKRQNQGHCEDKNRLNRKKSEKIIKNHSQRLKTENSSKVPQGDKSQKISQKKKKNTTTTTKPNKPKLSKSNSKIRLKNPKPKQHHQRNSVVFSDVSFHDVSPLYSAIMPQQNFYLKLQKNSPSPNPNTSTNPQQARILQACITIQRHFRGYLTRKYIEQSKYMIYCIIKIQKVWRGYACRKGLRKEAVGKRNLSIENSLITIKDFGEEHREERLKNKTFNFGFEDSSKKKEREKEKEEKDTGRDKDKGESTLKKQRRQQEQKYINILESLLLQQGLQQKFKQKIRSTLGRQKYVQNKIHSQIISQKSFNSPRCQMRSPKATAIMNSPSSWSKSKIMHEGFQNFCASPRACQVQEVLVKRLNSPPQGKGKDNGSGGSNSSKKVMGAGNLVASVGNNVVNLSPKIQQKTQIKILVKPLQTSFEFIQEFQLRIVQFLRDNDLKQIFLQTCKKCQYFRTFLVFSQWNKNKNSLKTPQQQQQQQEWPNYYNFDEQVCPDIFPISFRQQVVSESSMKIYLQDNNYIESLWLANPNQRTLYESYIKCIFDGLAQAIYQNYKCLSLTNPIRPQICHLEGNQLFKLIFMNSLTLMQGWSEYMCGAEIPVGEDDPNYRLYCEKNGQRTEIMIKNQITEEEWRDEGGIRLWVGLAIGEGIFGGLVEEVCREFFM